MIETPDYDDVFAELGDPYPVIEQITEATLAPLPTLEVPQS